ncbi:ATP-dependent DNA helicase DDX11-like [Tubulanus polymorphus]|uniref:ATP-dependent DNA helicase DDX11-like n=1 Tax=Tubulanus polymorphus TaxID=672921 RepID=UPI003DA51846
MEFDDEDDELFKNISIPTDAAPKKDNQVKEAANIPEEFPFPFVPYDIQIGFMKALYRTLDEGKIGIFESPTGTGKSLSLICGALKWLRDFEDKQKQELEDLVGLSREYRNQSDGNENCAANSSSGFDWISENVAKKAREEKAQKLKEEIDERLKREARLDAVRKRSRPTKQAKRKHDELDKDFNVLFKNADIEMTDKTDDDDDIIVADYASDDDDLSSRDYGHENDNEELEEGVHVTKIYFCSRTHSQLAQFVREIQKSPYGETTQVITLGSRQNLCINPIVKQLKSISLINEKCQELQKNKSSAKKKKNVGKCPYYKQENIYDLRDNALIEVQDIEQLVKTGKQLKACPYYSTRYGIPAAEVVALPYNILLHKSTREACGIKLKDNIVIIDEAHNLVETINSVYSVEVTGAQLSRAHSQLSQYLEKYLSRLKATNVLYIKQLLFILSNFIKVLKDVKNSKTKQSTDTKIQTVADFVFSAEIWNLNIFKIVKYCEVSQISRKLHGFVEKYNPSTEVKIAEKPKVNKSALSSFLTNFNKKENAPPFSHLMDKETSGSSEANEAGTMSSPLMHILTFISSLTSVYSDARIVIKKEDLLSHSSLKFLLLNPADHFRDVLSEAKSVIVAGGTMQPVSEFKDRLFIAGGASLDRIIEYSCGHVIPECNLLPLSLAKGPSGVDLDFTYQSRDTLAMLDELGRVLCNLCNIIPGGVVVFYPSYDYEKKVYAHLEKNGMLSRMSEKKRIFREPKRTNQVEGVLLEYSNSIKKPSNRQSGAMLFSVVGGKMSEGINFSDNLGRCIVMVGLPYPNMYSPELKEKMDYLNSSLPKGPDGKLPGQQHYENLCMKAVNQSIGRAIRHKDDYATIVLLDQRYLKPSIVAKLPGWISQYLKKIDRFGPMFSIISKFFATKKRDPIS